VDALRSLIEKVGGGGAMSELIYDQNIVIVGLGLMLLVVASVKAGEWLGRRTNGNQDEGVRSHISVLQSSLLGLTALLLGFTFSMALSRYDSRSTAVVEEANALGTTYLRAQLLPPPHQTAAMGLLKEYAMARVDAGHITLDEQADRARQLTQATALLDQLWALSRDVAREDGSPVRSGLFIQALNDTIDAFGRREAALERHVPELVLFLLYFTLLITGLLMGYGCGVAGHRPVVASYGFCVMMVMVVTVIIDIDRPRRGLIQVDQSSLINIARAIDATAGAPGGVAPATSQWGVTGRP
jgi:hypothetical protein